MPCLGGWGTDRQVLVLHHPTICAADLLVRVPDAVDTHVTEAEPKYISLPEAGNLQSGIYPDGNLCYRNLPVIGRAIHSGRAGYFNLANGRANHRRRGVFGMVISPRSIRKTAPANMRLDHSFSYSWGGLILLVCIASRPVIEDG